jgi:hypothetical protein
MLCLEKFGLLVQIFYYQPVILNEVKNLVNIERDPSTPLALRSG